MVLHEAVLGSGACVQFIMIKKSQDFLLVPWSVKIGAICTTWFLGVTFLHQYLAEHGNLKGEATPISPVIRGQDYGTLRLQSQLPCQHRY